MLKRMLVKVLKRMLVKVLKRMLVKVLKRMLVKATAACGDCSLGKVPHPRNGLLLASPADVSCTAPVVGVSNCHQYSGWCGGGCNRPMGD